jgi:hypothetical protein
MAPNHYREVRRIIVEPFDHIVPARQAATKFPPARGSRRGAESAEKEFNLVFSLRSLRLCANLIILPKMKSLLNLQYSRAEWQRFHGGSQ